MKVLDLMVSGDVGGIESLVRDYALYTCHDHIYLCVWSGGINADIMRSTGENVIVLGAEKGSTYGMVNRIIEICKQEHVDVVVSHHSAPLFKMVLSCVKYRIPKVRTIAYAHSNAEDICKNVKGNTSFIRKFIQRKGFEAADVVIAISQSVKDSLMNKFGLNESKISVIYNGVSLKRFHGMNPYEEQNIENSMKIIFVGRLIKEKGVQVTLQALSELPEYIHYHFDIVGDGPYKNDLERLTESFGLTGKVTFLGSRNDVPELVRKADLFVHMPVWEEGFGISIIEAMASGIVCICANAGAISEIITDGLNGYLISSRDYRKLSEKLEDIYQAKVVEDESLHQIRRNAIKRAHDFSIEDYSRRFDGVIRDIYYNKD